MNIGEALIWESSNLLLHDPRSDRAVMLVRWFQGRAVFTERDWLLLFGEPREKVFTTAPMAPVCCPALGGGWFVAAAAKTFVAA